MSAHTIQEITQAVSRSVELPEGDSPADGASIPFELSLAAALPAAPDQVWQLLADREELLRWYGPVTGDLRPGGRFRAPGGATGEILRAEEPHTLVLSWEYGPQCDELRLTLDPDDTGSELTLLHVGTMPQQIFTQYGPGALGIGWDIAMLGLAARASEIGGGSPLLPGPVAAVLTGPQGRDLVRAWAVRWAAAAIVAGVDEEQARKAETATIRAYAPGT